ncbi:DUF4279 domain-containing protein [Dokdonella sp.]|uniref:DUF4279 domain-containing protein n=1 Tax=Dokdonella sp. TaxID=2291710 RepID=UPI003784CD06
MKCQAYAGVAPLSSTIRHQRMATVRRSVATLRIAGDELRPDLITEALGHEPTLAQTKGETLVGKKTGILRIAKFGMWRLAASEREPADLDSQVAEILSKLTSDLAVWRSISSAYSIDLFCGLFMDQSNEGLGLSPSTLADLGNRGIELGLDIYSGPDEQCLAAH